MIECYDKQMLTIYDTFYDVIIENKKFISYKSTKTKNRSNDIKSIKYLKEILIKEYEKIGFNQITILNENKNSLFFRAYSKNLNRTVVLLFVGEKYFKYNK